MREPIYAPFRRNATGMAETPAFPDTPLDRVRFGARALRHTAMLACRHARKGRPVDLTGLDGQVGLVCAKALDLPPEEGRIARAELEALLADIDTLCEAMRLSVDPH
ncbi:MAG TPA: hypothetical protein VFA03_00585 [Acetobacteraceae bacterium]|nr:hypothetical protein [Acetobacteraceae bacterium]